MKNNTQPLAIHVDKVFKDFAIPHTRKHTIKSKFTGMFKREKRSHKTTRSALQDISFEINHGDFFGIVGRNGSGKSTLLKMIAGIYQPTRGKITVNGKLVPFIELGVGFNPELSGRENVYLNGAILGFSKKEIDDRYNTIVEFAELENFMDEKLKNYSSGMQVRLAFSCATMAKAEILLVDEVLAVGDADFQRKCFNYFKQLKRDKKTVIFVSHDMNAIREYCDRAVLIENGVVLAHGKASDVATKYSRLFLDDNKETTQQPAGKRWGDGLLHMTKVETNSKTYLKQDKIVINQHIEALADIDDPIAGFLIKSASGTPIMGTNTRIKHQHMSPMKKGEKAVVKWEFANIFNDGEYFIDPAIVHGGSGTEVADWWEEAYKFTVRKEEHVPYVTNPDIDVSVQVGNKKS